ncbi:hypothetical protein NQ314_021426 [Rhamnusium bicolor]|uniref:SAM domain-containing protein n=1 Tax=Rhamnusium bicolor TaxID=1586634 RepID=A0AAV8WJG8_9CUCU|nr:hypothetical protein NQ314_021426 [Rhamnusium bicolor]
MDLLQSILRSCDAENYYDNFRNNGIDSFTLKILNNDDLQIVGVQDEDVRARILKHISNLQIPTEKKIDTIVSRQYALLILNQMSVQLHKHFANLSYALKREDTDICNVKVTPAIDCLHDCLTSLERQLEQFDEKIIKKEKKRSIRSHAIFPTIVVTALVLFLCKKICILL